MTTLLLSVTSIIILIWITWRLCSRRHAIPCPTWLGWLVELDNPFTKVNRAATIIDHLDLQPNMTLLDIGCGPGRLTIPIAGKLDPSSHITAMDSQAGMLQKTKTKAQKKKLSNITYLHAKIGENTLTKNSFDRVLLVTVLGEIPNQEAALKEIFDALKPEGILSITEIIFDPHFQRRSSVLKIANRIGFQEKNLFGNCIAYTLHLTKRG